MQISHNPQTPRIPQVRPMATPPGPNSPDPDHYEPGATGARHQAQVRCQRSIGALSGGVAAVGLGALGASLGSAVGHTALGAAVGGAVGAVLGYRGGYAVGGKLHQSSQAEPLRQWQDPEPTSPEKAQEFREAVTDLQHKLLDAGKVSQIERGFHQKQNWGGKAHMEFSSDLPEFLRAGSLAQVAGQSVDTAVRFSNGQGCPFQDGKPDVRGMAIKMNIEGKPADLLATNHITFAHDADQFMKFAAVSTVMQTKGPLAALRELGRRVKQKGYRVFESVRIFSNIVSDTLPRTQHIATESYWTQAMHVGNLTGRFVFTPGSGADSRTPRWGADKNYLRKEMEQDLEKGPVKMHVAFEAFTEDSPARDAHEHGEHVTYPVGDLVFDTRPSQSPERQKEEETVARMAFNPGNGFTLAGPMNESNRGEIYRQSAHNRGALEWDAPEVQTFFARSNA